MSKKYYLGIFYFYFILWDNAYFLDCGTLFSRVYIYILFIYLLFIIIIYNYYLNVL